MITFLILESNSNQRHELAVLLKSNIKDAVVYETTNYETAVSYIHKYFIQVFLVNVELEMNNPDTKTGIDFGMYIRSLPQYQNTPILYTAICSDKIYDAVNMTFCYKFLLKPYSNEEILSAVHALLDMPLIALPIVNLCTVDRIYIQLYERDIIYVEANGKEMSIFFYSENSQQVDDSLSCIKTNQYRLLDLKQLFSKLFLQCHKKYLVNMKYVKMFDKSNSYLLMGSKWIPVGRTYGKEVYGYFNGDVS